MQHACPCCESKMQIALQEQEAFNCIHIICANLPVNVRLHQVLLQFLIIVLHSMSDSENQNLS